MRYVLSAILCAAALCVSQDAGAATAHVDVRSNFYSPTPIYVAPGDTVVWEAVDNGHTVTAIDGRFDYYAYRRMNRGERVSFTFPVDETVQYYCRVHGTRDGRGMSGVVVVGDGGPAPSPTPLPTGPPVDRVVPDDFPSIASALSGIPPGSTITLKAGVYREPVTLGVPGVRLRGMDREGVIVDASGRESGIVVTADGVTVTNLTVRGARADAIAMRSAGGYAITGVSVSGSGIDASGSRGGLVRDVSVTDPSNGGVSIRGCPNCDTIVEDVRISGGRSGIRVTNGGGVVVRDSEVTGAGDGIVVESAAGAEPVAAGVELRRNRIMGSSRTGRPGSAGAGIWLAGAWHVTVAGNVTLDGEYGVLVSAGTVPSRDVRVASNVADGSARFDLAWDGVGSSVCFSGNTTPDGDPPTTGPVQALGVYECGAAVIVGVPDPVVAADALVARVSAA